MALSGRTDIRHPIVAGADLSALRYRFVKFNASGKAVASTAGDLGWSLIEPATEGNTATVLLSGKGKVTSAGVISAGDRIASDASGKAVKSTGTTRALGIALEDAVADQVFSYLVAYTVQASGES